VSRTDAEFVQGKYYHIYNRGCDRQAIFKEERNYEFLLRIMADVLESNRIAMIAYCLMPNHYHFVIRQETERPLSVDMQQIFNRYVKAFNELYHRSGTLFEERFKAKVVEDEEYLIHLCRYVHRNPLEAGLVSSLDDWGFSDYLEWIGKRKRGFSSEINWNAYVSSPAEYARFVLEYQPPEELEKNLKRMYLD
jgi:putative transposase